ncbi:hypothetical protein FHT86_000866 [Rhizobium sp. BK313]|uniref:DUF982 domain-containing protein n=1 Tax=Rhizobium sp. BK313 TaxID=2587081 RepID=UPI00105D5B37|nr:DUF982 domain-containing protein [Rhizobium sp. BK313]MBB3452610.1 hypothetical protein [Rhizobium sp. BK313]
MAHQPWNETITIESRQIGTYVTIDSTERAAHYMLQDWPGEESGETIETAKRVVLDAYKGNASIQSARSAFIAAAQEAGILFFETS